MPCSRNAPRMTAVAPLPGIPSVSNGAIAPATVAVDAAGRDDPFGDAGAELLAPGRILRLEPVRNERCHGRAGTRDDAEDRSQGATSPESRPEFPNLARRGKLRADSAARVHRFALEALLQSHEDLAETIRAHHHDQVLDTVTENRDAERKPRLAEHGIDADARNHEAEEQADERIHHRATAEGYDSHEGEHDYGEGIGRIEAQGVGSERLHDRRYRYRRHDSAAERREERPTERPRRLASPRHRIAIPKQRHVQRLAGNAKQDRGERTAVGS